MQQLGNEIKLASRGLRRDRAFALPVLVTLTLCIAANAAVFSVLHSIVLRPLPLRQPDRLLWISNSFPGAGVTEASTSVPDYYDRREGVPAISDLASFTTTGRTLGTATGAQRVTGMLATTSLFRLIGASPWRGRAFEDADGVPGQEHKIVLSYELARQLYGNGDGIGRDLLVNGVPHTVIGVMPRHFLFLDPDVRYWLPIAWTPADRADDQRFNNSYEEVARLRPGATLAQAQQQLAAVARRNVERNPALRQALLDAGYTVIAMPLHEHVVRDVRQPLYLLWAGVLFVLVIGCVNVANLTLVRATNRWREMAARQALGAGPWRLVRHLLVEALLLTATAGAIGLGLAWLLLAAIARQAASAIPRGGEIHLDGATLGLTAAIVAAVAGMLALIPILHGSRSSLAHTLRQEGRGGTAGRGVRALRRTLVAAQVAFAFVLLLGAGLLLASFREVMRVRTGFEPQGALSGKIALPTALYKDDAAVRGWTERALERLRSLPGVTAVGFGTGTPLSGSYNDSVIVAEGYVPAPGESVISPANNSVSPGYFAALGVPLLQGRLIDERDTSGSPGVIVVDESLAKKFWPGRSPLGRRMYLPNSPEDLIKPGPKVTWVTVVGVVGSIKQRGLVSGDERLGAYYLPLSQSPARSLVLVARTKGDPHLLANSVRAQLAALDPQLPFYDVRTMSERIDESVAGRRDALRLSTAFGALALLLATLGIYGALSYQVTQRTREIGIRMALGGESGGVFRLVLGEGAALLGIGMLVGAAGVFALRHALAAQLYGVQPFEPAVLLAVTGLLAAVALLACALPARRAAGIDPVVALSDT